MLKKAHKQALLSTHPTLASITITDFENDDEEYTCAGQYWGTGYTLVKYRGRELAFDPDNMHAKDPKRLFIVRTSEWSRFRIRSIILDSKSICKKTGISTSLQPT
jgi:hypothetical protein